MVSLFLGKPWILLECNCFAVPWSEAAKWHVFACGSRNVLRRFWRPWRWRKDFWRPTASGVVKHGQMLESFLVGKATRLARSGSEYDACCFFHVRREQSRRDHGRESSRKTTELIWNNLGPPQLLRLFEIPNPSTRTVKAEPSCPDFEKHAAARK